MGWKEIGVKGEVEVGGGRSGGGDGGCIPDLLVFSSKAISYRPLLLEFCTRMTRIWRIFADLL